MMKRGGIKILLWLAVVRAFFMEILASIGKSFYLCTQKMKNVQVATCRNDIVVYPTAFPSETKKTK